MQKKRNKNYTFVFVKTKMQKHFLIFAAFLILFSISTELVFNATMFANTEYVAIIDFEIETNENEENEKSENEKKEFEVKDLQIVNANDLLISYSLSGNGFNPNNFSSINSAEFYLLPEIPPEFI